MTAQDIDTANLPPPGLLRVRMELERHQDLTPAEATEATNMLVGMAVTLEQLAEGVAAMAACPPYTPAGSRQSLQCHLKLEADEI